MSSPSLARRADTARSQARVTSQVRPVPEPSTGTAEQPEALVISVHGDERGAAEAARWAERVGGSGASAAVGSDAHLAERVDAARRVLVLDPGVIAARCGFGARATARERLQVVARLADHGERVTWASKAPQAARWVRGTQE